MFAFCSQTPRDLNAESEKQTMGDTPTNGGETATKQPLEDKANPTTPQLEEKKTDDGEVEALRKKAEQAEMRANQLSNELKAKNEAEAKAKAEELKQNNEFKTLYEQTQAKLDEVERERQAEEQQKAVSEARQSILADYSDEVKETAKDLGLDLKDVTDGSVREFKEKLDKIQTRIGNHRVSPNNPGTPSGKKEYTGEQLREILNDPAKRDAYFRAKGGAAAYGMMPEA